MCITSFNEGISKIDNGAEDDIILSFSSSSLALCDLEKSFCASMYSWDGLKKNSIKNYNHIFILAAKNSPVLWLWMNLGESELFDTWSLLFSCTSLLSFPKENLSRALTFLSPPWIAAFACRKKKKEGFFFKIFNMAKW